MLYLIAIVLPPLAMFLVKKPFQALFALILQCTLFGWIPAAGWAILTVSSAKADKRHKELLEAQRLAAATVGAMPPTVQPAAAELVDVPVGATIEPIVSLKE